MNYHQVSIDPDAHIAPNATIIGDVRIGALSTILFNATIRGDEAPVTIGARSNIQEGCCIHVSKDSPCIIGDNVTVGHGAIVHGCTIDDGSLIGMGAIILDGAVIGKQCLVGAGALVTGGTVIPDKSLVIGSPAKVRRDLTKEELEGLEHSAHEYVNVGKDLVENGIIYAGAPLPRNIMTIARKGA